jgi:myo-inositol 2-dehydrogenase / D-chiro-inositol 1-dehydrogenase
MTTHAVSSVARRESRREFLAKSVLLASAAAGTQLALSRSVHAAGTDTIKLGLIGCGGRGSGAAVNALLGDENTQLWAMADVFADKVEASIGHLKSQFGDRIQVEPARRFSGLDGYKGVIENSDVVLIACASRFHAPYALATVEAKKHVFVEKPAAVDVVGVRKLLEADALAKKNGTGVLAGLTYRYHLGRREAVKRMHDGEIGEIVAIQSDYLRQPYGLVPRQAAWSEMEYQFRNWYHFTWLSGDDVPQSLIHNLDSALWAVHDEMPTRVYGLGGRATEFKPEMGTSFDHHSIICEYDNGRRIYGAVRTAVGCFNNNTDVFHGTKGRCIFNAFDPPRFTDLAGKVTWKADAELSKKSPYDQEHLEFLQSIREGNPFQRGKQLAMSTLLTVLGQAAVYTGKEIKIEEGLNSNLAFPPEGEVRLDMEPPVKPGTDGLYPIARPGE